MEETAIAGISGYEAAVGPAVQELAKLVGRGGRLARLGRKGERLDLPGLRRDLEDLGGLIPNLQAALELARDRVERYSLAPGGAEEAEYARLFEAACLRERVELEGEFPFYRVFPFEVRFHLDQEKVLVNNRTQHDLAPGAVARLVREARDRLLGARFNGQRFAQVLLRAYDILLPGMEERGNSLVRQVPLKGIHALLNLRPGESYSESQFAFDLYRLRQEGSLQVGERHLIFGESKTGRGGITVPVSGGGRQNLVYLEVVTKG